MFSTFGVPLELSSDGGPEFAADLTKKFLRRWSIEHRVSSAYNAQSNGRAEVAVKTTKRLLRSNVDGAGSLDNDRFMRAMLTLRNTPDADCNVSPAQILFGRPLRDNLTFIHRLRKYSTRSMSGFWRKAWSSKERALCSRFSRNSSDVDQRSRPLSPLHVGEKCLLQNGHGNHPKKWGLSGEIMEVLPHHKYLIQVDGSRRLTTRNRKFIKSYIPDRSHVTNPCSSRHSIPPVEPEVIDDEHAEVAPEMPPEMPVREEHPPLPSPPFVSEGIESSISPSPNDAHSNASRRRPALALRRLDDHNPPGIRQAMKNPAGRRAGNRKGVEE